MTRFMRSLLVAAVSPKLWVSSSATFSFSLMARYRAFCRGDKPQLTSTSNCEPRRR